MRIMKWQAAAAVAVMTVMFVASGFAKEMPMDRAKPRIQVAVLLDTSNSMDGLIAQAKTQLWKIVNEFATAKKDGKTPELQVALYEYGNSSIPAGEGYIRMIVPFTTDLDKISEGLFALTTNGGDEYCGKVIGTATQSLNWSPSNQDYKVIFIAGNEPFTQGNVDYRTSCTEAIRKGIIINTVFCGNFDEGVRTSWKDGADLADGKYMNIDHNAKIVQIDAPQDKEIARLSAELNKTYLAYGTQGEKGKERQEMQDRKAGAIAASVLAERAVAKASSNYRNTSWDMVDGLKQGNLKIENIKKDDLPKEMRDMKPAEQKAYVEKKAKEREKIQQQINRLNEERKQYVAMKMKEAGGVDNTFDAAVIKAIREQAAKKDFQLK